MALDFDQTSLDLDHGYLNDLFIQMETIEDNFEKAIARYDYPYADGADLEDMGQKAHTIRVRCYFWDDAEQQTYADHKTLLDSLATQDLLDFVHPKYGLLKGKIESIAVMHDDSIRKASLDISFVEQMRGALNVASSQSVLSAVEDAYLTGQDQQLNTLAYDIKAAIPTADAGAVTKILDADTGLLVQMQEFSGQARVFVGSVEDYLAISQAVANQELSPLNLPGRILGSHSSAVEKIARLFDSSWNYPRQFISKLNDAFDDLQDSYVDLGESVSGQSASETMTKHLQITCAQRLALEAAAIYAADEQAFRDGDPDFQVMNIRELEETLAIVRTRIEAAVEVAREMDSLKTMAAALLTQINSVRLEREKMIAVTLDNPMPLHLVCLKYGLPYTDAERLLKVNRNIQNPNFADGEVFVYAR